MELNKVFDVKTFLEGLEIPQEQAEKLQSETAWRQAEPVANVRSKIAGLAQAYAAAAVAAIASPQRHQHQNNQPEPSVPLEAPQQMPEESLQGSAGPAPKLTVDAARDAVGALANDLGGEGSPTKSDDEAGISPLGAQLPPTQRQQQQQPESSEERRKEAEAMPPPPTHHLQQQQQQFLLPTQPQYFPGSTDGTEPMDIDDYGPGFQDDGGDNGLAATETLNTTADDGNDGENQQQEREEEVEEEGEKEEEEQDTRPTSPIHSADIAQLPITQPIPYGGTLPDALNNTVSVQWEAIYEEEEEEEISPARARATVAAMLAEREQHQPLQITQPQEQQHADEDGEHEGQEKPEHLLSPSARNWIKGVFAKFGRTTKRTASPAPVGRSGNNKKHAPGFGGLPTGGNGTNVSGGGHGAPPTAANAAGWRVDSQGLQPTQAMPQSTSKDTNNDDNNLNNTQEAVQGVEYGMNPRDQHLAMSIDARLDAGGALGGGGGEGAASPMRPPRPFHQPFSVEAIGMEEEEDGDVEEGGVVDEGAPGVRTRSGLFRNNVAAAGGGLVQRASSSVAQTGAAAAAAAAADNGIPSLGGARNNIINTFSAAIGGFGGPLTQDFLGVTATQEDIEAILGAGGAEDAGNAIVPATAGLAVAGGQGREASIPPAEPSRGPGNATLTGRDLSKNAARTTGGMDENHESEGNGNEDGEEHGQEGALLEGEVQTSPEKPAAAAAAAVGRITRRRAAEEMSGDLGGGGSRLQGIEYSKKRKTNPTKIVVKRTTRAAALLEEEVAVAATTGSTGVSDEDEEEDNEGMIMPDFGGGGGGYHDASMPPPPMVNNIPELAGARDMPTPRGPTPAAQLPGRTLAAREKLHALIRQRQIMSASPSAADNGAGGGGVPQPAGVYAHPTAAAGGLRVAVQRDAVASGGGSGHNSVDYRTPMAGQTPVHSTLAPGGGLGATRVVRRAYLGPQQRRQQPQPSAASGGGGAAKSSLSSLLGL